MSEINFGDIIATILGMGALSVLLFFLCIVVIVAQCKLFSKAGYDWWAALIPVYNSYVLFEIIYGNGWKFLLMLIPVVGQIAVLVSYFRLAQQFNQSLIFCLLSVICTPITMCIMAFGDAEYRGTYDGLL